MHTGQDKKDMDNLKFPEELGNGPIKRRWITDILFGILFVIFLLGMGAAAGYGFYLGDPRMLMIGWDSDQNGCGYSPETQEYSKLYWPESPDTTLVDEINKGNYTAALNLLSYGTCVKSCPSADTSTTVDCKPTAYMKSQGKYTNGVCQQQIGGTSAFPVYFRYDTIDLGSFCIPDGATYVDEATLNAFKDAFFNSVYGEVAGAWAYNIFQAWAVLLVGILVAVVFGYLYLFVIRLIGGAIIWISFVLIVLILAAGGCYTWFYMRPTYDPSNPVYEYLAYGSYTLWALSGIVCLLLLCCYNAVKLGIAVFKTTAQYIQANMSIFALPAIATSIAACWFILWFSSAIFVFSVGTPTPREGYPFITEIMWNTETRWIFFYHVFGLFWVNAFILGCAEFVIGCSACIWYFEVNTDSKGKGTVRRGYHWLVRYHLGSIAFGSFMIAICQMIRFLFEYYRKKIQTLPQTKLVKALICMTRYLLWLMEKCVKYMTKNAYIQIALTCNNFCQSAWNAFTLMLKHAHRFGAGNSIGFIYNLFGCLCIASATAGCGYLFMSNFMGLLQLQDPIPPTVVLAIISAVIALLFLSIFSYSSDAILQSFLLDEEMRFLGGDRPEAMQEFANTMKNRGKGCCEFSCI